MSKDHAIHDFYNAIYKRYDLINRLFTFKNDQKWRKLTAKLCLEGNPAKVLDLCCGTGDLTIAIGKLSHNKVEVTGCDFNLKMLHSAEIKAQVLKLGKIRFIQGTASNLPFASKNFDCLTIGFGYRNLTFENSKAIDHLHEIRRVLKPGGKLFILESGKPEIQPARFFYHLYLRFVMVPLGGLISGNWKAYKYLAYSSANFFNIDEVKVMLEKEGFSFLNHRKFFYGAANLAVFVKTE